MQDVYYSRYEVSNSDLSDLEKYFCPPDFIRDATEAYRFGRLVDVLITEPKKANLYTGVIGGEWYSPAEIDLGTKMKRAFLADKLCRSIADQATGQQVFSDPGLDISYCHVRFRLPLRCKYDLWMPGPGWGADIKSTTASSEKQFRAAIDHFNYDRQRYVYMLLSGARRDMLIGISKVNQRVFKVPIMSGDDLFLSGKEKFEKLAFKYWELFGQIQIDENENAQNGTILQGLLAEQAG